MRAGAVVLALVAVAPAAHAVDTEYQCTGYRALSAGLTPHVGQVRFEGQHWTVTRVRDAREARYVNTAEGVTLVARGRTLELTHGGETLQCKLLSDALGQKVPASAPSAAR